MQTELVGCDLENTDAIALLEKCQKEEVSISEKIQNIIQNFLPRGDNHLLKSNLPLSTPFLP